jgi:polyferredoxin
LLNRIISVVMALILCLFAPTALADSGDLQERYSYIGLIDCTLEINNGEAECIGRCKSLYSHTDTEVKLSLRRREEGSSTWTTIATWSGTQNGKMTVNIYKTKSVSRGYYYQLQARCTIKDSNGKVLESSNKYSTVVKYI